MTLRLLVKELHLSKKKFVTAHELKEHCKKLNMDYYITIGYLLSNNYLVRLMRGIFYIKSIEERKLNKVDITYTEAIAKSLALKKVKRWYFGLETAIKLDIDLKSLDQTPFTTDSVLSDVLFRAKDIKILGHKTKFIKLKKSLFGFGIVKRNKIRFSENEKTLLDIVYLYRYNRVSSKIIRNRISDLIKYCSKGKVMRYSKKYNRPVVKFVKEIYGEN